MEQKEIIKKQILKLQKELALLENKAPNMLKIRIAYFNSIDIYAGQEFGYSINLKEIKNKNIELVKLAKEVITIIKKELKEKENEKNSNKTKFNTMKTG